MRDFLIICGIISAVLAVCVGLAFGIENNGGRGISWKQFIKGFFCGLLGIFGVVGFFCFSFIINIIRNCRGK